MTHARDYMQLALQSMKRNPLFVLLSPTTKSESLLEEAKRKVEKAKKNLGNAILNKSEQ